MLKQVVRLVYSRQACRRLLWILQLHHYSSYSLGPRLSQKHHAPQWQLSTHSDLKSANFSVAPLAMGVALSHKTVRCSCILFGLTDLFRPSSTDYWDGDFPQLDDLHLSWCFGRHMCDQLPAGLRSHSQLSRTTGAEATDPHAVDAVGLCYLLFLRSLEVPPD